METGSSGVQGAERPLMEKVGVPRAIRGLLLSRKFWMALLSFIAALVLYVRGQISADQLVDAILILAGAVIAAIALEDAAEKHGGGGSGLG